MEVYIETTCLLVVLINVEGIVPGKCLHTLKDFKHS